MTDPTPLQELIDEYDKKAVQVSQENQMVDWDKGEYTEPGCFKGLLNQFAAEAAVLIAKKNGATP